MVRGFYLSLSDRLNGAYVKVKADLLIACEVTVNQCDNREEYERFSRQQHPYSSIPLLNLGKYLRQDEFPLVVVHTPDARVVGLLRKYGFNTLEELLWNRTHGLQ